MCIDLETCGLHRSSLVMIIIHCMMDRAAIRLEYTCTVALQLWGIYRNTGANDIQVNYGDLGERSGRLSLTEKKLINILKTECTMLPRQWPQARPFWSVGIVH